MSPGYNPFCAPPSPAQDVLNAPAGVPQGSYTLDPCVAVPSTVVPVHPRLGHSTGRRRGGLGGPGGRRKGSESPLPPLKVRGSQTGSGVEVTSWATGSTSPLFPGGRLQEPSDPSWRPPASHHSRQGGRGRTGGVTCSRRFPCSFSRVSPRPTFVLCLGFSPEVTEVDRTRSSATGTQTHGHPSDRRRPESWRSVVCRQLCRRRSRDPRKVETLDPFSSVPCSSRDSGGPQSGT